MNFLPLSTNVFLRSNQRNSSTSLFSKFFIFYSQRRGLSNDTFVIRTGVGQLNEMGQVIEVNNQTQFSSWMTPFCNQIQGSDGLFFPRSNVQTKQDVRLFHKDSCKFLPLNFDDVQTVIIMTDSSSCMNFNRNSMSNKNTGEGLYFSNLTLSLRTGLVMPNIKIILSIFSISIASIEDANTIHYTYIPHVSQVSLLHSNRKKEMLISKGSVHAYQLNSNNIAIANLASLKGTLACNGTTLLRISFISCL